MKILIAGLFSLFVSQSLFLCVDVIIPLYVENKFNNSGEGPPKVSAILVSIIMVGPEISAFFFSPFVPNLSQAYGRKNVILAGFILSAITLAGLSFTVYIENHHIYVWTALLIRLLLGVAD